MTSIDDQIAELEARHKQKLAQLTALKEKQEARKLNQLMKGQRSEDTRRKILAGALVLDLMAKDQETNNRFMARLDQYLTRTDDRALFGLTTPKREKKE
jgi:hypothetical protein